MQGIKRFLRCRELLVFFVVLDLVGSAMALGSAVGGSIERIVCNVMKNIYYPLITIGMGLVALMIVYAGLRYVYSADDPGGRKQAKSMIINAIIGGILLIIALPLAKMVINGVAVHQSCIS